MNVTTQALVKVISIPPTMTIRQAMQAIDAGGLGAALITDANTGQFLGLITDGDIRRALLSTCGLESQVLDVYHPPSVTAPQDISVEDLVVMLDGTVDMIPLLDRNGCVVDLARLDKRMRLSVAEPSISAKELEYVSECVLTGWVSSAGKFVTQFERLFADFCNVEYAVAVSNGTVALHLALETLGVGPGDEVIVPSLTFAATANAVIHAGATPVMVDCTKDTWTIDPLAIEEQISPKTRAIIPVHLYGHPANMDPIMELAARHDLFVIEDAAEAHGARYKGKRVGSIGHIGCFSFYGNKIVTTGEGGMLTLNRAEWDRKARILRDHGMDKQKRYWHTEIGYNYRLTNLQAAIGVAQMERVEQILHKRSMLAAIYSRLLANVSGITLPPVSPWAEPVCWLYSILLDEKQFGLSRNELIAKMAELGVDVRPFFYPLSDMPVYAGLARLTNRYPVTEMLSATGLNLPSSLKIGERGATEVCGNLLNIHRQFGPEYI